MTRPRSTWLGLPAALAASAVLAAGAVASGNFFQGNITTGGHVELHARFHNHRASKILTFKWDNVVVPGGPGCGAGGPIANGELDHAVKVNAKGRFHYTHTTQFASPTTVTYTGDFNNKYTKVTGTLRISGYVAGGGTGCDTGTRDYAAHN